MDSVFVYLSLVATSLVALVGAALYLDARGRQAIRTTWEHVMEGKVLALEGRVGALEAGPVNVMPPAAPLARQALATEAPPSSTRELPAVIDPRAAAAWERRMAEIRAEEPTLVSAAEPKPDERAAEARLIGENYLFVHGRHHDEVSRVAPFHVWCQARDLRVVDEWSNQREKDGWKGPAPEPTIDHLLGAMAWPRELAALARFVSHTGEDAVELLTLALEHQRAELDPEHVDPEKLFLGAMHEDGGNILPPRPGDPQALPVLVGFIVTEGPGLPTTVYGSGRFNDQHRIVFVMWSLDRDTNVERIRRALVRLDEDIALERATVPG